MAKVYASLIMKDEKKFAAVPEHLKEAVAEILKEKGQGHLIDKGDNGKQVETGHQQEGTQ